jgi:hypothetical protein
MGANARHSFGPQAVQPAAEGARPFLQEAATVAVQTVGKKMRVISQAVLPRLSRLELTALLRKIPSELPALPEGSHELRVAYYNLYNIPSPRRGMTSGRAKPRRGRVSGEWSR